MKSLNRVYVPELDQLRAFAALLVYFYHTVHMGRLAAGATDWPAANPLSAILVEGHTGVALFMVVSGFVLARGVLGKPLAYGQFLRNRLLRIFPLMTFVLAFAIYGNTNMTLSGVLAPFMLLSNLTPRPFTDITHISGTVWTIAIEFQFYLIAPFVFAFVSQRGLKYLFGLMLLAWLAKCLVLFPYSATPIDRHTITYFTIAGRLNQFLIGVGLAYIWPAIEARLAHDKRLGWPILAAGIAAAMALAYVINNGGGDLAWRKWMYVRPEAEAIAWALVIAGYVLVQPLGASMAARALGWIGVISFSIYILHYAIERLLWMLLMVYGLNPATPTTLSLLAYSLALLPVVLAVSWLSYTTIEQPFLDMRRRYVDPAATRDLAREAA